MSAVANAPRSVIDACFVEPHLHSFLLHSQIESQLAFGN
jgi:hypothetical protein